MGPSARAQCQNYPDLRPGPGAGRGGGVRHLSLQALCERRSRTSAAKRYSLVIVVGSPFCRGDSSGCDLSPGADRRTKPRRRRAFWGSRRPCATLPAGPARLQATVLQQIADHFGQQVGCLRRRGSSLLAASGGRAGMVSLRTRPWRSTSCLLSRARCRPRATRRSPGSMRSAASCSVDALQRRFRNRPRSRAKECPKAFPGAFATGPCAVTILWQRESG